MENTRTTERTDSRNETKFNEHKVKEALDLLSEAAKDSKDELQRVMSEKYNNIRELFSERGATVLKESAERVKQLGSQVDNKIHNNPWPYLGGIAFTTLLVGFIMGRHEK